jgi:hypothetical protein
MDQKIKIIEWTQEGSPEPTSIYRLGSDEEAKRFFRDLFINAETDGREIFRVSEITADDFRKAQDLGYKTR